MPRRRPNPESQISPDEAKRAIYIDCEGFMDKSPALIGLLIGEQFEQVVLDPDLELVAKAREHRMSSFKTEATRLYELSEDESRMIVAYSQHEKNMFLEYAGSDLTNKYRDARKIAVRWKNTLHRDEELPGRGLKDFLKFIGYHRGSHLGDKKTTSRLRAVRDMIVRRGNYELLTPVAKGKWTKLLEHNLIDCDGMRELVIKAAKEMANT